MRGDPSCAYLGAGPVHAGDRKPADIGGHHMVSCGVFFLGRPGLPGGRRRPRRRSTFFTNRSSPSGRLGRPRHTTRIPRRRPASTGIYMMCPDVCPISGFEDANSPRHLRNSSGPARPLHRRYGISPSASSTRRCAREDQLIIPKCLNASRMTASFSRGHGCFRSVGLARL